MLKSFTNGKKKLLATVARLDLKCAKIHMSSVAKLCVTSTRLIASPQTTLPAGVTPNKNLRLSQGRQALII
jgi:hypothetical protein